MENSGAFLNITALDTSTQHSVSSSAPGIRGSLEPEVKKVGWPQPGVLGKKFGVLDRGQEEEDEEELRNDLEEMLFERAGIGKSNFFVANRDPGASGDRGTGLQYQSYGERGGWTDYEYPENEFVPLSGEEDNYVFENEEDFSAGSESDELNDVEYGDVGDRRISVDADGERRGTHSGVEELRTTSEPHTYKTTIKYKTTVNDSFNYIRLENDPTSAPATKATATTTTTKTTVTTTTITTHSTFDTTVRYIENGKGVHWPRVPTSSFFDYLEHENEISPEGATSRTTVDVAEEREADEENGNTIVQHEIPPKTTPSSPTPASTSTTNFLMPEIRVTYVPPDKREAGGGGAKHTTTEKVLTGGVLFGGGSGGGAENKAVRFSHLSTVTLISLVLTFLNVQFVLNQ